MSELCGGAKCKDFVVCLVNGTLVLCKVAMLACALFIACDDVLCLSYS
jgi:hypothetical protein